MTNQTVNLESLCTGRKCNFEDMLEDLWVLAGEADTHEIRQAAKHARENMIKEKDPVIAHAWRAIMDELFTMFIEKKGAIHECF